MTDKSRIKKEEGRSDTPASANRVSTTYKNSPYKAKPEKRLMHKNAYEHWTPELDAALKEMYYKGILAARKGPS